MFSLRIPFRTAAFITLTATAATLGTMSSVSAKTAAAGPPWISIETPVNPYDASTRGAYLVVHAFHHGTPVAFPVTGTAEGMVNGQRKSVALQFTPTSRTGAYALKKQWGDAGVWTLVIAVHQESSDVAQALVEVGADGEVARVRVPTRVGERDIRFPAAVSAKEINDSLMRRAGK